ncbi:MAG: hypothetical protein GEU95_22685 [Rhizobiales bacterium]|nr:hypothetical protein [Hyphomicrobiales bacterium]
MRIGFLPLLKAVALDRVNGAARHGTRMEVLVVARLSKSRCVFCASGQNLRRIVRVSPPRQ